MNNENKEVKLEEVKQEEIKKEEQNPYDFSDKAEETINKIVNTNDITKEFNDEEVTKYKDMTILCYIPFLVLYPLIKKLHKSSKYMLFHINQGMNLFIFEIAVFLVTSILTTIFSGVWYFPRTIPGWILFIKYILYCAEIALILFGINNSVKKKAKELPVIGKFRFIK